jgi:hypothetical protein
MQSYRLLKQVVRIVTTGLLMIKPLDIRDSEGVAQCVLASAVEGC